MTKEERDRMLDMQVYGSAAEARAKCRPVWGDPYRWSQRHDRARSAPPPVHAELPDSVRDLVTELAESPEVGKLRRDLERERVQAQRWYELAMGRPAGMEAASIRALEEDMRCWRARALAAERELERLISGMERGQELDPLGMSELAASREAIHAEMLPASEDEVAEERREQARARQARRRGITP